MKLISDIVPEATFLYQQAMVNIKLAVLHNKMWIICDTEEPRGTMRCSCNKAWLGYTVFRVCLGSIAR